MTEILYRLLQRLTGELVHSLGIIPWSSPIHAFGDVDESLVATVGLNPSNLEFVDHTGTEIDGPMRRFHTLRSLGLNSWKEATGEHIAAIAEYCRLYFERNPYDSWFRPLDRIMVGTNASYYRSWLTGYGACHLDLVPFATEKKWTELSHRQHKGLLSTGGDVLEGLIRAGKMQVLILNGATVVNQFEAVFDVTLNKSHVPSWDLPRKSSPPVRGTAYKGFVSELAGKKLGRRILVLGYNHNLQSSYGITRDVTEAIQEWIRLESSEVIS